MPMASARAIPRMYGTKIAPDASGLRPSASIALLTAMPRPMPGPMAPRPMARPAASVAMLPSTVFQFLLWGSRRPTWPAMSQALRLRGGLGRRGRGRGGVATGPAVVSLLVVAAGVLGDRGRDVGHRQQGEDERLDEPEEELQAKEDGGNEERRQREHRRQQHLAGKDVAEESHGETDEPAELADEVDREHQRRHIERLAEQLPQVA